MSITPNNPLIDPVDVNNKTPEEMTIQELRRAANAMGIQANRDWNADDFRNHINSARKNSSMVGIVVDLNKNPPVGHARIKLNNNDSGQNYPVPVSINRYILKIPRNVVVDVPLEVLEALNHSTMPSFKSETDIETGQVKSSREEIQSYPYQLIAITPGTALDRFGNPKIKGSSDPERYRMREEYKRIYGRWPKRLEFKSFKEAHEKARAGISVSMTHEEEQKKIAEAMVNKELGKS